MLFTFTSDLFTDHQPLTITRWQSLVQPPTSCHACLVVAHSRLPADNAAIWWLQLRFPPSSLSLMSPNGAPLPSSHRQTRRKFRHSDISDQLLLCTSSLCTQYWSPLATDHQPLATNGFQRTTPQIPEHRPELRREAALDTRFVPQGPIHRSFNQFVLRVAELQEIAFAAPAHPLAAQQIATQHALVLGRPRHRGRFIPTAFQVASRHPAVD